MRVSIFGSTGSIGKQALDVIRSSPERFEVAALVARQDVDTLASQAREFGPSVVAVHDASVVQRLRDALSVTGASVFAGDEGLHEAVEAGEIVLNAVVGFAGLPVTLATLEAGRDLALANKESLIAAGPVVQRALADSKSRILPVDSEHAAVHQCLRAGGDGVRRIILTASGGPFRGMSRDQLSEVTVEEALNHPTWTMGSKITVDSSTLMNKGLEVIEAHELFGVDYAQIEVVVHPQSIVHSMVEFRDGSTVAQLSCPDMRLPIGYALGYPDRLEVDFGSLDWRKAQTLNFEPPDHEAFPCVGLAYEAGAKGQTAPAWLSAANEVAVAAFLGGRIPWLAIADVIRVTMEAHDGAAAADLGAILEADRRSRAVASRTIEELATRRIPGGGVRA